MGNTGKDSAPPEHDVKKTGAPVRENISADYAQLATAFRTEEKAVGPPIPTEGDAPGATPRSGVFGESKATPSGVNSLLNPTVAADVPSPPQEEANLADATAFIHSMKEGIRGDKKQKPVIPKESTNLEKIGSDKFSGSRKEEKKLSLTEDETPKDNAEKPSKVEGSKSDNKQEISLVNSDEACTPEKEAKGIPSERKEGKNETTPGQTGKKYDLKRKRVADTDCGTTFLKVIDGPAIGTKALDDASVEKTIGGKDNSPPPQAPKESDEANAKEKSTEEKDDGPPMQLQKEADVGSVKRNTRQSAVSGDDGVKENTKSPGRPAKGRRRGSKAGTKAAPDGVKGHCGKSFLKVTDGPAIGTKPPPQAPKESNKTNTEKTSTEEKDDGPPRQLQKETNVGNAKRNKRLSAVSDDEGGEENTKSPRRPAKGRRRGSRAGTKASVNGADVVEVDCGKPFLKVTDGSAIRTKALDNVSVENTTGGKVDGPPPQAPKESDEANVKKKFTEEKEDGPLLPSQKEADVGSVKRNKRRSAVSDAEGGEENTKSPGRPAKGRRGSKAGTKAAGDGADRMEGDCGKTFLKVTDGPAIGTKALDGASVENTTGGKVSESSPQAPKESDEANDKKKFTEEKNDGPLLQLQKEADVGSVKRQSAVSGDDGGEENIKSPGRPAKGRRRRSKAGTKAAGDGANVVEGDCGKPFLKVTDEPFTETKALDGASVEKTTGGKDNGSPPQAPKESDEANDKKKFTEEKDDGPPPQSLKEADVGGVKRNKRQSAVSCDDGVKKNTKSPGRPAKGRRQGSNAGTKAAGDGADGVEGDCGIFFLKVTDGPAIGTKALDGASVEKSTGRKVISPPPQAPKETNEANDKKQFTEEKDDGPPMQLQKEADVGSVKRNKRQRAVSGDDDVKENTKSPGRPAKGRRRSLEAGTKGATDGVKGHGGKSFLKVTDGPAIGTQALDDAFVENTTGGKVDGSPPQAPKESDEANDKKNVTEASVKRKKRQSAVSDNDGVKNNTKSPGRPAKGRRRGSKAGTKAAAEGADMVEGDCGKPFLKVTDRSAIGTKALDDAFMEKSIGGKVSEPSPQAPKESDEANVKKKMTGRKSDGSPMQLQKEADVGSVKRNKRRNAVSDAEGRKKNTKSPGRAAKGRRGLKAGTKAAGDGADVVEGDTCAASLVNPIQGEAVLYHTLTPETVPSLTETPGGENCARVVLTVSCGNSFNNWSILRNVNDGMQIPFLIPFLFWKSSLMIETDWKKKENYAESSTLPLSNFLSKTAFDLIFGIEEGGDCVTPQGRVHVYITSSNSKQTSFLCRAFSVVPNCVVVLLRSQNFFLDSMLPYTGMGVDRLASIRGAAKLSGYPALVIDGGTAMTYTAADSSGRIIGGAIGAGVGLKLFALKHRTDALPEVDPSEVYKMVKNLVEKKQKIQFFAKSTKDAMVVDIVIELLNKLRSITSEWLSLVGRKGRKGDLGSENISRKENVERNIYLTGGDGALFELLLNSQTDLGFASSNSAPEDHDSSVTLKFESKLIHYGMCDTIIEALAKKAKKDDEDKFLGKRVAKFFPVVDKEENCLFLGKVNEVISSRGRNEFHLFYDDLFEEIIRKEDLQESISLYKEHGEMETVKVWPKRLKTSHNIISSGRLLPTGRLLPSNTSTELNQNQIAQTPQKLFGTPIEENTFTIVHTYDAHNKKT